MVRDGVGMVVGFTAGGTLGLALTGAVGSGGSGGQAAALALPISAAAIALGMLVRVAAGPGSRAVPMPVPVQGHLEIWWRHVAAALTRIVSDSSMEREVGRLALRALASEVSERDLAIMIASVRSAREEIDRRTYGRAAAGLTVEAQAFAALERELDGIHERRFGCLR